MRSVVLDDDRRYDPFHPRPIDDLLDLQLGAMEHFLAPGLGPEQKAFEITESIVDYRGHLAGVLHSPKVVLATTR